MSPTTQVYIVGWITGFVTAALSLIFIKAAKTLLAPKRSGPPLPVIYEGRPVSPSPPRPLASRNLFPGWPRCANCNRVFGHDKWDRTTGMCDDCLELLKANE